MTQGFDEWYLPKKHFLDDCESGYFECYEAGAASRQDEVSKLQAKIDSLHKNIDALHVEIERIQKEYSMMFEGVQGRQKTTDELQKRIDEALIEINIYYDSDGMEDICLCDVGDILKGEKDE